MRGGTLRLCAVLGLLRWAGTLPSSCHRLRSDGRRIKTDCSGPSVDGAVECTFREENGNSHRGQLRLSSWTADRAAPLFEEAPSLVKKPHLADSGLRLLSEHVLNSTQLLKLNNIQLPEVPAAALSQLPNLRTLDMNNNRISQLRRHQLQVLPCLSYLTVAENGLRRVEVGALPDSLKQVCLRGNQLHTLNGTVRHLDNLSWLLVSENRLRSLASELPAGGRLDTLLASGNRLRSVAGLQDARRLRVLSLASNRLRSAGRLQLPRLRTLNLASNRIQQVSVEQLVGLPALKELDLSGNRLSELGPILTVLPALIKLNLSHNQLSSIARLTPPDQQGSMTPHSLKELFAAGNRITTLGQLKLPKLRKVNLADNQLTQVSEASFAGLLSLEELVLSGNRLRHVGHMLSTLPALTSADFSSNSISSVTLLDHQEQLPHESKPRLLNLQTLLLNNNSLQLMDVSLYRLPALCVLDVRNNAIGWLRWDHHQAWRCSRPRKLRIDGNPVRCEDQKVRSSLRQAALSLPLDVPPCA